MTKYVGIEWIAYLINWNHQQNLTLMHTKNKILKNMTYRTVQQQ